MQKLEAFFLPGALYREFRQFMRILTAFLGKTRTDPSYNSGVLAASANYDGFLWVFPRNVVRIHMTSRNSLYNAPRKKVSKKGTKIRKIQVICVLQRFWLAELVATTLRPSRPVSLPTPSNCPRFSYCVTLEAVATGIWGNTICIKIITMKPFPLHDFVVCFLMITRISDIVEIPY